MSTTIYDSPYTPHQPSLTQYYGGEKRGMCIQLTAQNCDGRTDYVGMTVAEARTIGFRLLEWALSANDKNRKQP